MKQVAYRYALIRYRPDSITGEFANIGVAMEDKDSLTFSYHIALKNWETQWVVDFFTSDRLTNEQIRGHLKHIQETIDWAARNIAFNDFTYPREGILTFSPPRAVLTDNSERKLLELYMYHTLSHTRKN